MTVPSFGVTDNRANEKSEEQAKSLDLSRQAVESSTQYEVLDLSQYKRGMGWVIQERLGSLNPGNLHGRVVLKAISMKDIVESGKIIHAAETDSAYAPLHEVVEVSEHAGTETGWLEVGDHCVHASASADAVDNMVDDSPFCIVDLEWIHYKWDPWTIERMVKRSLSKPVSGSWRIAKTS